MQITLHALNQEVATGAGSTYTEPGFKARSIVIHTTQISVNVLGNIQVKLQHSPDNANWFDVPSLGTGNITTTGAVIVSLSDSFPTFDNVRLFWTFSNANSITFTGYATGLE